MAEEKKLIIDEDWKAQVAAEKAQQQPPSAGKSEPAAPAAEGEFEMPPASWELLLTTLATEAMMSLGLIPHPATGEAVVHRKQAKYLIDTIEMLCDKSQGNLTSNELQFTEAMLHQLRMAFIGVNPPAVPTPPDTP